MRHMVIFACQSNADLRPLLHFFFVISFFFCVIFSVGFSVAGFS